MWEILRDWVYKNSWVNFRREKGEFNIKSSSKSSDVRPTHQHQTRTSLCPFACLLLPSSPNVMNQLEKCQRSVARFLLAFKLKTFLTPKNQTGKAMNGLEQGRHICQNLGIFNLPSRITLCKSYLSKSAIKIKDKLTTYVQHFYLLKVIVWSISQN